MVKNRSKAVQKSSPTIAAAPRKSRSSARRTAEKKSPREYELRACGYSLEVTSQKLSEGEAKAVRDWCAAQGFSPSDIMGSLEGILPGYNCYSTNRSQAGSLPTVSYLKFFVLDDAGEEVLSFAKLGGSKKSPSVKKTKPLFVEKGGKGNILVYFEESKGTTASWHLSSDTVPTKSDFSFSVGEVIVGADASEHIESAYYKGEEIERDYDSEFLRGKAAYSRLL